MVGSSSVSTASTQVIEIGRDTGTERVRSGTGVSETLANLGAYAQALF